MKPIKDISEYLLIRKLRKGDRKAQFVVYERYYKAMYSSALRITQDTAEAEDVMQESFIVAFDKINTFKGDYNLGGWIKRIVINKALDVLRKRHLQLVEIDENNTVLFDEEPMDIDTVDKVQVIKDVLGKMPENQRLLISLHLFDGYSHEEIAEQLGMNHNAVRTAYSRAKKKLQNQVEQVLALA